MAVVLLGFSRCFLCHLRMHKVPARRWGGASSSTSGTCHSHDSRLPRRSGKCPSFFQLLPPLLLDFVEIMFVWPPFSRSRRPAAFCIVVPLPPTIFPSLLLSHNHKSPMNTIGMSVDVIAFKISQTTRQGRGEYAVLALGRVVQLGELRGLPQDCPIISPTCWVNKNSLLPIYSYTFPAQTPRLLQFNLGNSVLKPNEERRNFLSPSCPNHSQWTSGSEPYGGHAYSHWHEGG